MGHLLYLMFRCDGDVMESLDFGGFFGHLNTPCTALYCTHSRGPLCVCAVPSLESTPSKLESATQSTVDTHAWWSLQSTYLIRGMGLYLSLISLYPLFFVKSLSIVCET